MPHVTEVTEFPWRRNGVYICEANGVVIGQARDEFLAKFICDCANQSIGPQEQKTEALKAAKQVLEELADRSETASIDEYGGARIDADLLTEARDVLAALLAVGL